MAQGHTQTPRINVPVEVFPEDIAIRKINGLKHIGSFGVLRRKILVNERWICLYNVPGIHRKQRHTRSEVCELRPYPTHLPAFRKPVS